MTTRDDDQQACRASTGGVLGCRLPVNPALREQGWEWRCNTDGTKLGQIADAYRELGFEVRVEQLDLRGLNEDCAGCRGALAQSSAVFVRKRNRPR